MPVLYTVTTMGLPSGKWSNGHLKPKSENDLPPKDSPVWQRLAEMFHVEQFDEITDGDLHRIARHLHDFLDGHLLVTRCPNPRTTATISYPPATGNRILRILRAKGVEGQTPEAIRSA